MKPSSSCIFGFSKLIKRQFQLWESQANQAISVSWLTERNLTTRVGEIYDFKGSRADLNTDLENAGKHAWPKADRTFVATPSRGPLNKDGVPYMELVRQVTRQGPFNTLVRRYLQTLDCLIRVAHVTRGDPTWVRTVNPKRSHLSGKCGISPELELCVNLCKS